MKRALTFFLMLIFATCGFITSAQTLQTLVKFNNSNGAFPETALTLGSDGNFYGTTYYGGLVWCPLTLPIGLGTIFKMKPNGNLIWQYSFGSYNSVCQYLTYDGAYPSGLTMGADGNYYGTTLYGGTNVSGPGSAPGTVFRITPQGAFTSLVSFNYYNGWYPQSGLTLGSDGNLYGMTSQGCIYYYQSSANYSLGTIFKIDTNGTLTTVLRFNFTNGANPVGALTLGYDGNLYGTTPKGGITNSAYPYGMGTVFKVATNGVMTTLITFNGTNGASHSATLTLRNDGNFCFTASGGGYGSGTLLSMTTNGVVTKLNGPVQKSGLTAQADGAFYGVMANGGNTSTSFPNGMGTLFRISTNDTLTTLITFNGTNGAIPSGHLTLGNDGNIYGTTSEGGLTNANVESGTGYGTIFRLLLPPFIIGEPQSQTNLAGATAIFLVSATSLNSISYQWQKNGTNLVDGSNISGSITNILTITSISDSDVASYSVIVSNANSGVISSNAMLTVIEPPSLAVQFVSGNLQLNLGGMLSNNFIVQYSTNLAYTNWINLFSISNLSASPYLFIDPAGIVPPARFYRAVMQ